jgi:hypothetical protein
VGRGSAEDLPINLCNLRNLRIHPIPYLRYLISNISGSHLATALATPDVTVRRRHSAIRSASISLSGIDLCAD